MPLTPRPSRQRYRDYRNKLRQRRQRGELGIGDASIHGSVDPKKRKPRSRPFLRLLGEFWGMLRGFRSMLVLVLTAVTISTVLGLIPLYGTKIIFDSVLKERPASAAGAQLDSPPAQSARASGDRRGHNDRIGRGIRDRQPLEPLAGNPHD